MLKNLKSIIFIALAVTLTAMGISFAETARLGQNLAKAFNPTRTVAKTAAYTLVGADSVVEVTATSANITITLPAIADVTTSGTKAYKIIKKDATDYDIVVTPASGETIGFESTRYLIGDEDYIVISASGGKNWSVDFESPYLVENHASGTYSTGIGSGGLYSSKTVSTTLTASDCGNIITATTATLTFTLPATIANCKITIINGTAAYAQTVSPNASDKIMGGFTLASSVVNAATSGAGADDKDIVNTTATSIKGDYVILIADGVDGWYIIGSKGIWAFES